MTNKTHALDRRSESTAEACLKVAQVKGLAVLRPGTLIPNFLHRE